MNPRISKKHDWSVFLEHIHNYAEEAPTEQIKWLASVIGNLTKEMASMDERIEFLEEKCRNLE